MRKRIFSFYSFLVVGFNYTVHTRRQNIRSFCNLIEYLITKTQLVKLVFHAHKYLQLIVVVISFHKRVIVKKVKVAG